MMIVHSNLKAILDSRGLSIRQVAKDIDCHFESLRRLYNDDVDRYPRDILGKLCEHLEVGITDLLILSEK